MEKARRVDGVPFGHPRGAHTPDVRISRESFRGARLRPGRALAVATAWLMAVGTIAAVAPVRGSDPRSGSCAATPWIAEERAEISSPRAAPSLAVATYNLHSGLGLHHAFFQGRRQVERNLRAVARSIAVAVPGAAGPDIVALNEVDFGSRRSGWLDQARFVADEIEAVTGSSYQVVRGETWRRDVPGMEVRFGNAALVRLTLVHASACLFDDLDRCELGTAHTAPPVRPSSGLLGRLFREPRGVIRVTVELEGRPVDVLVTHLDAFAVREREIQASVLLSRFLVPGRTTVLLGDMNAVPSPLTRGRWMFSDDRTHAILATGSLADAAITLATLRGPASLAAWATFPADAPVWGLDWVLGSLDLMPEEMAAIGDTASDHRGLYVRYRWLDEGADREASRALHARICERLRAFDSACGSAPS